MPWCSGRRRFSAMTLGRLGTSGRFRKVYEGTGVGRDAMDFDSVCPAEEAADMMMANSALTPEARSRCRPIGDVKLPSGPGSDRSACEWRSEVELYSQRAVQPIRL